MREEDYRKSENIEDRRGQRGPGGGGMGGMPVRMGGMGIGGLVIVAIIAMLLGINPLQLIGGLMGGGAPMPQERGAVEQSEKVGAPSDEIGASVAAILATTEDVWTPIFAQGGMQHYGVGPTQYEAPRLVLFDGSVASACGNASAAMGPFYCPADSKVYLDTSFFRDLHQRFSAPGDFAQAYVIAHEVGHHIQNLLGIAEKVARMRGRISQTDQNQLQVMMELQADCFAGVWGYHTQNSLRTQSGERLLEAGDMEEALNAANAIGDDRLQRQAKGYVVPDSFTHGTSEQRMRWFKIGFEGGNPAQCDTFNARQL